MMTTRPLPRNPRFIALCGYPKSGKSEVAKILSAAYGAREIDDGRVLRDCAKRMFGLTEWHVTTQAGKESFVTVCGKQVQVRKILGDLGKWMDSYFGDQVLPEIAVNDAETILNGTANPPPYFVFPSCRKTQGLTYKRRGGVVVQVSRPGVGPSGNDFDLFDESLVDFVIHNDGSFSHLRRQVISAFDQILDPATYDVI